MYLLRASHVARGAHPAGRMRGASHIRSKYQGRRRRDQLQGLDALPSPQRLGAAQANFALKLLESAYEYIVGSIVQLKG
jgi:hypothetical protein